MVHDSWLILIFVKYTERYRSCWLWTNREYVALVLVSCMQTYGWWMNLNVSLLGYDVLVPWKTRSRLRTRLLLFTHTTINDNYTRPRINFDVEWIHGTVSCYKRTASTLTLVHVWTWICHCLVYDAPWHHRNYTLACYWTIMTITYVWLCADAHSPAIQTHNNDDGTWHTTVRGCWFRLNTYIVYIYMSCWLWTNRKYVGMHWCMFEFECVITWYTMHHDTIAIVHLPAIQLQLQWYTALRWCTLACYSNT